LAGGEPQEGAASKKRRFAMPSGPINGNSFQAEIPGFKEALAEAFESAGVNEADTDLEEVHTKIDAAVRKHSKKFYNDPRTNTRMTAAEAKSFMGEFVDAMMGAFSNTLYEKEWFEKVSWNGALLMVVFWTFENPKMFTRVLKTQLIEFIDEGILAWSEEERITRAVWKALENATLKSEGQMKKVNAHLMKAYDDAHFNAPYGSTTAESLSPELATLQDFVKGWMTIFIGKGWGALEAGLQDGSPTGIALALTVIFQQLMDPENPCLPVSQQPILPPAPWSFIDATATELIADLALAGRGKN